MANGSNIHPEYPIVAGQHEPDVQQLMGIAIRWKEGTSGPWWQRRKPCIGWVECNTFDRPVIYVYVTRDNPTQHIFLPMPLHSEGGVTFHLEQGNFEGTWFDGDH